MSICIHIGKDNREEFSKEDKQQFPLEIFLTLIFWFSSVVYYIFYSCIVLFIKICSSILEIDFVMDFDDVIESWWHILKSNSEDIDEISWIIYEIKLDLDIFLHRYDIVTIFQFITMIIH